MTLTFVPKIIVVGVVCVAMGGWMLSIAVELAKRMFAAAAGM
jgi:flagellar biosynthetic protein FliQ